MAILRNGWTIRVVVLAALVLLPLVVSDPNLSLPTEVFIYAAFALTYDVVFGYTGLISFGHALFVGAGAYALAIAMTEHGLPLGVALVASVVAGTVLSTATGALALRTRGVYFAVVTLALAQAAFTLAQSNVGNLTGGENGQQVIGLPFWLSGPGDERYLYFMGLILLVLVFLFLRLVVSSPAGRVWQAIRDNEQRALMIGYRPYVYKLMSYVVAGTLCSLAGAVFAIYVGFVNTDDLSADLTILLLLMVIIGGAGSLWGAIVGAAILRYVNHYLLELPSNAVVVGLPTWMRQTVGQPLLILGLIYLLLIYFFPQGMAGLARQYLPFARSPVPSPGLRQIENEAAGPVMDEPDASLPPGAAGGA
jgi:branched-chain amino acid transport system permease protein